MTVKELLSSIPATLETKDLNLEKEISGVYCGDLLSYVMSKSKEDNIWITIQSHMNIIAVASLLGHSAIIISEGGPVGDDVIEKAIEEEIIIIRTDASTYDIAKICAAKGL